MEQAYRRNLGSMVSRANRKVRSHESAEDLVQETVLAVLSSPHARNVREPGAYLNRALNNQISDHHRYKRDREIPSSGVMALLPVTESGLDPSFDRIETQDMVQGALLGLNARQRQAIELELQDRPRSQIAEMMDVSVHAATAILIRARAKVRLNLLRSGYLPGLFPAQMISIKLFWTELRSASSRFSGPISRLDPAVASIVISIALTIPAMGLPGQLVGRPSGSARPSQIEEPIVANRPPAPRSSAPSKAPILTTQSPNTRAGTASSRTVLKIEAPGTHMNLEEEEKNGPPEPHPVDQVLGFLQDPGKLQPPRCPSALPCK